MDLLSLVELPLTDGDRHRRMVARHCLRSGDVGQPTNCTKPLPWSAISSWSIFVLLLKRHTGSDTEHHGARVERRNSSITSRSTPVRHFFLRFQSDLRPGPPVWYRAACREAQRDFAQRLASDLQVQTDAAASVGFGAICGGEWFTGCWSDLQSRCCITYMGLYPIALACSTWGHKWMAKRIQFLTDNQAVAACITSGTCRCGNMMSVLRALFFVCAKNNCQITATYFPGSTNTIADALS